jgi:predicted aspartyl protease
VLIAGCADPDDPIGGNYVQPAAQPVARQPMVQQPVAIQQPKPSVPDPQPAAQQQQPSVEQQQKSPESAETIQLERNGGILLVPVLVNDAISLKFILDSGASDVSVPADVVLTLLRTGTVTSSDFIGQKTYVLADGSKLPSAQFRLRTLKIGAHVIRNVTASVAPVEAELLLGQSFLSRLPAWTIDNRRGALVLNSPKTAVSKADQENQRIQLLFRDDMTRNQVCLAAIAAKPQYAHLYVKFPIGLRIDGSPQEPTPAQLADTEPVSDDDNARGLDWFTEIQSCVRGSMNTLGKIDPELMMIFAGRQQEFARLVHDMEQHRLTYGAVNTRIVEIRRQAIQATNQWGQRLRARLDAMRQ